MTADALVELHAVHLGYGRRTVLRNVTLTVERGQFLALVGRNGSGKTTLLRAIAGILTPHAGRVRRSPALSIGWVPQERDLDPIFPLAAVEVVLQGRIARLGPWRAPAAADRDAVRRALAHAGVAGLAETPFQELSSGQKQRVLIARALATEPLLMVLDEPTFGTDPASQRAIMDLLRVLHAERALTVVLATHDLGLAANYATRVAIVDGERQVFRVGAAGELLTGETLSRLYGCPIRVAEVHGRRTILVGGEPC